MVEERLGEVHVVVCVLPAAVLSPSVPDLDALSEEVEMLWVGH